jgi:hypothetical protein
MRRLRDLCADYFFEGVDALAIIAEGEHEMHAIPCKRLT